LVIDRMEATGLKQRLSETHQSQRQPGEPGIGMGELYKAQVEWIDGRRRHTGRHRSTHGAAEAGPVGNDDDTDVDLPR
jgi:hypothetical protein